MSVIYVEVKMVADNVRAACGEAVAVASRSGLALRFVWNGEPIMAKPCDDAEELYEDWFRRAHASELGLERSS